MINFFSQEAACVYRTRSAILGKALAGSESVEVAFRACETFFQNDDYEGTLPEEPRREKDWGSSLP
jgi:hypothetical protein